MQKVVAALSHINEKFSSLDNYISIVNSNIEIVNQFVKVDEQGLKIRGHSCDDIIINLLKEYLTASNSEYVTCMKHKKDNHNYGENMIIETLIVIALKKI